MAYTMEQANALLAGVNNEGELRDLISQLDVSASGSVTVLYSGMVGDEIHSSQVVDAMIANGDDVRVISNTEAARFLDWNNNQAFADALFRIFNGANPADKGSVAYQFLQGSVDAYGTRMPNGAWDVVSASFAEAATGDVRTLTPFADPTRVFAQTELTALLNNTSVTSINGLPKTVFVRGKWGQACITVLRCFRKWWSVGNWGMGQACITVLRCFRRVSETVTELREAFSSRATKWLMLEGSKPKSGAGLHNCIKMFSQSFGDRYGTARSLLKPDHQVAYG